MRAVLDIGGRRGAVGAVGRLDDVADERRTGTLSTAPEGSRPGACGALGAEPSNEDDDATTPPSERRLVRSMSEAAAVPVAPTRHRHPKM